MIAVLYCPHRAVFAQRDGQRELLGRRLVGGEDRAEEAEHTVDRVARLAEVRVGAWGGAGVGVGVGFRVRRAWYR